MKCQHLSPNYITYGSNNHHGSQQSLVIERIKTPLLSSRNCTFAFAVSGMKFPSRAPIGFDSLSSPGGV